MRGTRGGGPIGTEGVVGAGLLGCGGGCCSAFFFCSRFSTCLRASNSCTQSQNKEENKKGSALGEQGAREWKGREPHLCANAASYSAVQCPDVLAGRT